MLLLSVLFYLHCFAAADLDSFQGSYSDSATRLRADLLSGYDKVVPPVSRRVNDFSQAGADVSMELLFIKVEYVDASQGIMNLKAWVRMWWTDERLSWNPENYGNITQLHFHAGHWNDPENTEIWLPDIQLWNALDGTVFTLENAGANVHSDGSVFWSRPGILMVMCRFSGLVAFPYDRMTCVMEFGGWTVSGGYQGLHLKDSIGLDWSLERSLNAASYSEHYIHDVQVQHSSTFYASSPQEPWHVATYIVVLNRRSLFFSLLIVFPTSLVTIISFGTFWIAPKSKERLSLGIATILLIEFMKITVAVFLPVCGELLWMDLFLWISSVFCVLSLVLTTASLYLAFHRKGARWQPTGLALAYDVLSTFHVWTENAGPSLVSEAGNVYKDIHSDSTSEASKGCDTTTCITNRNESLEKKLMYYEKMFSILDPKHVGYIGVDDFATMVTFLNLRLSLDVLDERGDVAKFRRKLYQHSRLSRRNFLILCADPVVLGNVPIKQIEIGMENYFTLKGWSKMSSSVSYQQWSKNLDKWMRVVVPVLYATVMGLMANAEFSDGYDEIKKEDTDENMFQGWGEVSFSAMGMFRSCIAPVFVVISCVAFQCFKKMSKSRRKVIERDINHWKTKVFGKISSKQKGLTHPGSAWERTESDFQIEETRIICSSEAVQPSTSSINDSASTQAGVKYTKRSPPVANCHDIRRAPPVKKHNELIASSEAIISESRSSLPPAANCNDLLVCSCASPPVATCNDFPISNTRPEVRCAPSPIAMWNEHTGNLPVCREEVAASRRVISVDDLEIQMLSGDSLAHEDVFGKDFDEAQPGIFDVDLQLWLQSPAISLKRPETVVKKGIPLLRRLFRVLDRRGRT